MTMCFNYTKKRLAAVARRSLLGEIWKSRNGGKVFGEDRYKCEEGFLDYFYSVYENSE